VPGAARVRPSADRAANAQLLSEWRDGRLLPLSPSGLRTLAARVCSWPVEDVPAAGLYRHWYHTQREAIDAENASSR